MPFRNLAFFIIISTCLILQGCGMSDSARFFRDYPAVGNDNLFTYRSAGETADILAKGRGVVFIGTKDCAWCQQYAVYLQEAAREAGITQIYYCDIREDRQNNTAGYQKIIGALNGHLQRDDEGRPCVYVPHAAIVSRGRIITNDYETSHDTQGCSTPEEYWTSERMRALKERLKKGMKIYLEIVSRSCNTC